MSSRTSASLWQTAQTSGDYILIQVTDVARIGGNHDDFLKGNRPFTEICSPKDFRNSDQLVYKRGRTTGVTEARYVGPALTFKGSPYSRGNCLPSIVLQEISATLLSTPEIVAVGYYPRLESSLDLGLGERGPFSWGEST